MSVRNYIFLLTIVISLLIYRFYNYYSNLPEFKDGQEVVIQSRVNSEPEISGKLQRFRINLKGTNFYVTSSKSPIYRYAEYLRIEGRIKTNENKNRIFYSISFPKITRLNKSADPLSVMSLWVRNKAIEIFEAYLSPVHSALLLGIVFGIKQAMPEDFLKIIQDAGVVHVIAASGMNVSMVAGSLFFMLKRFFKRQIALIFSILGIILYVFIAGFEASIIRASIMAGITFAAGLSGRQKLPMYALFLTAIFMLFINPSWLFDVGFQLSFLATLGIITLKPIFDQGITDLRRLGILGDDLTTTLAAQIATLPILIINFGSINLLSVVVNMLVLWTIPFIMIIGGISILMGLIFTQIGSFLAILSIPLLMYFEIVVTWFDRYKLPITIEKSNVFLWVGYYVILFSVVFFFKLYKGVDTKK